MDILLVGRIAESETLKRVSAERGLFDKRFPVSFLKRGVEALDASFVSADAINILNDRAEFMYMVGAEGVFNALWNLGELVSSGLKVDITKIPVAEFVIASAELCGESPYNWDSTGCILLTAENGAELVRALKKAGTDAAVIGYLTDDNDRCIINGETERFLTGKE